MHAVGDGLEYHAGDAVLRIASDDAPLVALGDRSPLNFSRALPRKNGGAHVCLFNNAWGTNYPQWCGGSWTYRFRVEV